jgi:IS1 family transposase
MNRLSTEKRAAVIGAIVEGMGIRATCRMTGVSKNTVSKLLLDLGDACSRYMDRTFRNLTVDRIEADEIWSFVHAKDKNLPEHLEDDPDFGSVWTWTALDADTKLIVSWLVGSRNMEDCYGFMSDLRARLRPDCRFQLSTDGYGIYEPIVDALFRGRVDYGQVIKDYGKLNETEQRRYSPAECQGIEKRSVIGNPVESKISTSYVERQNLSMRMGNRRFTRLTNAHSKRIENHVAALAIYFAHYNLCRPHETLTKAAGRKTTPAMAAGIEDHPWSISQLCELLED